MNKLKGKDSISDKTDRYSYGTVNGTVKDKEVKGCGLKLANENDKNLNCGDISQKGNVQLCKKCQETLKGVTK